jgi:hypothetical protein
MKALPAEEFGNGRYDARNLRVAKDARFAPQTVVRRGRVRLRQHRLPSGLARGSAGLLVPAEVLAPSAVNAERSAKHCRGCPSIHAPEPGALQLGAWSMIEATERAVAVPNEDEVVP